MASLPVGKTAKPVLSALAGERLAVPPLWLMRQAGRYLPEYREVRARVGGFLDLCYTPSLAAEVTLQPIRRFGFDAAILFSDILVVPDALGQRVRFVEGEGPRLDPVQSAADLTQLRSDIDLERLAPVFETIERVKAELPAQTTFLGFCGAPWTVATYMVAGQGTDDQAPARLWAYREPELFAELIDILVEASISHLEHQLRAGVDAVQIFETWAGVLPPAAFDRWCVQPVARIVSGLRARVPGARVIGFPRGASAVAKTYAEQTGIDAIGLDWTADLARVAREVQPAVPVQGNLDPLALLAGGEALDHSVAAILSALSGGPFIFNLGHGILPQTPVAHVERLVARVRGS